MRYNLLMASISNFIATTKNAMERLYLAIPINIRVAVYALIAALLCVASITLFVAGNKQLLRDQCDSYSKMTERKVRFDGQYCYVQMSEGWFRMDQINQGNNR